MTTIISPPLGHAPLFTQQGVGATPGYDAIDLRRAAGLDRTEGPLSSGAYAVTQRGAGANMSVDIAASTGSVMVQGDAVTAQSCYPVPAHSAVINEAITAADPTNPRVDLVVLEVLDNVHDASGSNLARTRVVAGTPTAGATLSNLTNAGVLPNTAMPLAYVLVGNGVSSITSANILDARPKTRGKSNIATAETITSATYTLMTTPDRVAGVVLPTDGLLAIGVQGTWSSSLTTGTAQAAIFLNGNQLRSLAPSNGGAPLVQQCSTSWGAPANADTPFGTSALGLVAPSVSAAGYSGDVTTGQVLGGGGNGGVAFVFAAAGTYTITVQFQVTTGTLTVKNRRLWVWTVNPDLGVIA